mmetsp:Transcript_31886/g.66543  ORF Transcript_31886/g.66543 Transcript_31886/m.66543 type:complete len:398 (+) Transcript_31886:95-1288(+)
MAQEQDRSSFFHWDGKMDGENGQNIVRVPSHATGLVIPEGITHIPEGLFLVRRYDHVVQVLVLPESLNEIPPNAFEDWQGLVSVQFGSQGKNSQLQKISDYAFLSCYNLQSMTWPASLESIGNCAFYRCPSLQRVVFPHGSKLKKIESFAFKQCTSLQELDLSQATDLTTLESHSFSECSALRTVLWPPSLEVIEAYAFRFCTSLQTVVFPLGSKLKRIGRASFHMCTSLEEVDLSQANVLTQLEDRVFEGCKVLQTLCLPDCLQSIGAWAFDSCQALEHIQLPPSLVYVGHEAFCDCQGLVSVQLGSGRFLSRRNTGDFIFLRCKSLKLLELPSSEHWPVGLWPQLLCLLMSSTGVLHWWGIEEKTRHQCMFAFLKEHASDFPSPERTTKRGKPPS